LQNKIKIQCQPADLACFSSKSCCIS